jgi:hypothetical protein
VVDLDDRALHYLLVLGGLFLGSFIHQLLDWLGTDVIKLFKRLFTRRTK